MTEQKSNPRYMMSYDRGIISPLIYYEDEDGQMVAIYVEEDELQ